VSGRYVVSDEFARQFGEMARRLRYTQPQRSFPARRQHFTQTPSGIGFRNDAGETIPAFAVMKITGEVTVDSAKLYTVAKPDSTFARLYLVNGPDTVTTSQLYGTGSFVNTADRVLYDSGDGTPAAGQVWGPYPSQWSLKRHMYGFRVQGDSDSTATTVLCVQHWVMDVVGKADGAISLGSSGTVSVWKGDRSADSTANVSSCVSTYIATDSADKVRVSWHSETPEITAKEC
jgi:hypothetical protein